MSDKLFFTKKSKSDELLDSCCPKLSYKQRLIGFIVCSAIGWIISILAMGVFFSRNKDIAFFAVLYTLGNIVCIMGTCFLSGPKSQVKAMKHKSRIITTIVFILSMAGTLVFALAVKIIPLCIAFIVLQFLSYIWYTLSFIPFGQRIVKKVCCSCCDPESQSS
ncbi:vesicle transporter SFT2B (macronuclear) [Tetrahymena thermophila SB210]|uniref:Vesicle transport protein n=1 Tax=Tetrahymena thermophila (strain SB210) TaxID=312017 RepID=Q23CW5_TETTS|nr:vesicle transporter SFT2B [Tetrahymena thermophila SB210]EAR94704.1 vesicle transporter SFT2B [Tetrahymena thermophila SB210]|eukprot:XP_001014921.1 vesicle transporter SFT2B [Tetrahymena thermophila SB210]